MMKRLIRLSLPGLALAALLASATTASADISSASPGAVYTLTNSPAGNAVLAFSRAADGTLTAQGSFATGGNGSGSALGSQGALVLSDDGRRLFAVNAGSNSISLFDVGPGGIALKDTVASGGSTPISLTVHGSVLYVLNAGGSGSISGFAVGKDTLEPIAGSTRPLGTGSAGPAQVQFSPQGDLLVVTEKASSTIDTYPVGDGGLAGAPVATPSAGGTPFGFDFDNRGHLLVSEAAGSASSYDVTTAGATAVSGAVATHQGAPCWLVATKNGRYAYAANAGGGSISGFAVGQDGSLTLLDPTGVTASLGAGSHPLDEAVSGDGRYLYDLADGAHLIGGFRIAADGSLAAAGSVAVPAGAAGIAAR
jgi:6-phosphogluconolactonase (cycloisomerase 2 family)